MNGPLTVATAGGGVAGTVSPGSVGTLAAGSTVLAGTYACDVSGSTSDLLAVTGNLDISAATLTVSGTLTASTYTIASYTDTITGTTFATISPALTTGYAVKVDTTAKLVQLVKSGYSSWAQLKGLTAGVNDGVLQDPDLDGISNLLEYILGGDPLASGQSILPTVDASGSNLVFTFIRLSSSQTDTTLTFQYGSDLVGWTDVAIPATTAGSVTITPATPTTGSDTVVVTVAKGSNSALFGRLKAVK